LQSQQTLPLAPGSRTTASHFSCFLFLHLPTRTNYHIHSSTSVITLIDTCLGDDCLCQHRLIPRKKISGKSQHYTAGSGERVTRVTLLTSLRKRGRDSTPSYSSGHVITTTSKIMRYMLFSPRLIRFPPFVETGSSCPHMQTHSRRPLHVLPLKVTFVAVLTSANTDGQPDSRVQID
jgi:hypothetical protein